MQEKHFLVDGKPISASLFDFGLYFFHNAQQCLRIGQGPYFYLPKLESHREARLWNDVFNMAQDHIGLPRGTVRATVLIETLPAAFEMDEILYELKAHTAGLNCGRWDYIFSFIKKVGRHPEFVLPDRASVTMNVPFMKAYVDLLIYTCHRRGVHAMGGMAAQIPIKDNQEANQAAMNKVKEDKLREVQAGHDGTWVAHPGLIPIAMDIFNGHMPKPNQIAIPKTHPSVSAADLLNTKFPGSITEKGLRSNISVALQYLVAWIQGNGCVPIANLMEDAATAEIARAQVWQWLFHKSHTSDSKKEITPALVQSILTSESEDLIKKSKDPVAVQKASKILSRTVISAEFTEFLTEPAYEEIVTVGQSKL